MDSEKAYSILSKDLRIISGRGKKYLNAIADFDSAQFVSAVKEAIRCMNLIRKGMKYIGRINEPTLQTSI